MQLDFENPFRPQHADPSDDCVAVDINPDFDQISTTYTFSHLSVFQPWREIEASSSSSRFLDLDLCQEKLS